MRNLDFSSWPALLSTLAGLALITLIGVGMRLLVMQSVQQRRERQNRQINERLKTLIAAYKTLGGSFTGTLRVVPTHLKDVKEREAKGENPPESSDRARRMRDAVEAALADIVLLGTEEQVRLAAHAASELVAGRAVETSELVVSLRNFIRSVLELDAIPSSVSIPQQGPARPGASKGGGSGKDEGGRGGKGGGSGGGGGAMGGGLGLGLGVGVAASESDDETH
ncbi:MAG: hypothetical protein KIT22_18750 [Verrucomicrobiae bacterium]|nr:hypothetical protein [Verrucomicrobiae bacterium]